MRGPECGAGGARQREPRFALKRTRLDENDGKNGDLPNRSRLTRRRVS